MNKQPETTLAAIIHTSGFLESVKIAGLEDMQLAVDGKIGLAPMDFMRLAEPLSPHEGKFHVYVNTDGANRRLPLNLPVALAMGMLVHGDVLVTGWPDEDDGAVTDLPTEVWHELPRMLREPEPPTAHVIAFPEEDQPCSTTEI